MNHALSFRTSLFTVDLRCPTGSESQAAVGRPDQHRKAEGCREPGITETIITCKTGIRYNGVGHNGIRYNTVRDNGIRYNGERESVITLKWAIWNRVPHPQILASEGVNKRREQ